MRNFISCMQCSSVKNPFTMMNLTFNHVSTDWLQGHILLTIRMPDQQAFTFCKGWFFIKHHDDISWLWSPLWVKKQKLETIMSTAWNYWVVNKISKQYMQKMINTHGHYLCRKIVTDWWGLEKVWHFCFQIDILLSNCIYKLWPVQRCEYMW